MNSTRSSVDDLRLKSGPRPVTRINRRLLILVGAILFAGIALLVLVALQPPSWRTGTSPELVTVENKPATDRLSELPSSYDAVGSPAKPPPVTDPELEEPNSAAPLASPQIIPTSRYDRQALESPVFFRLQLKETPRNGDSVRQSPAERAGPSGTVPSYDPASAAQQAADRAQALANGGGIALDAGASDQSRKLSFLNEGADREIYNPHQLEQPASPYQLLAGSIISASLLSGLNSDLPGFVIAQVTEQVFDSVAGRHLLIPQGSRLIGRYDSVVAFGQERALVIWQRIIRPDGSSILIDNLPATDTGGYTGLADQIDLHSWKLLKGVALATVLGLGSSLAFGAGSGESDIIRALREANGQTASRTGEALVERNLNVQPTLTVRPGWPLRVIVHKDMILKEYAGPMRPRLMLSVVGLAVAALLIKPVLAPLYVLNLSPSVPVGLYRLESGTPCRGGLAVIRLREPWRDLAAARGYLSPEAWLIKPVAALAGDHVCRSGRTVTINGRFAALAQQDGTGSSGVGGLQNPHRGRIVPSVQRGRQFRRALFWRDAAIRVYCKCCSCLRIGSKNRR